MKLYPLLIFSLLGSMPLMAQTDSLNRATLPVDSLRTEREVDLKEVVIEAPKVVRKADMDLLFPSATAVEQAKNGMQLLQNLMIPGLLVNEVLGQVKSAGEEVQLRINGRVATVEQVKQLLPETVKRVEWIDNPGLRYQGAKTVLNFIVTNPSSGGALMLWGMQAVDGTDFGSYFTSLQLNHGRSQWTLSPHYKYTRVNTYREYEERFTYPDGHALTRTEKPIGGYTDDTHGGLELTYSYIKPDTTVWFVSFNDWRVWNQGGANEGLLSLDNGGRPIRLFEREDTPVRNETVTTYYEHHFPHNHILAVDFRSTFYNGRALHDYRETEEETGTTLTDVSTVIRSRNRLYALSADYIKKWDKARLTVGASYTANRNRMMYNNVENTCSHQRQDKAYLYGEYYRRFDKWTLTAGLGAQYAAFNYRETGQGSRSWNLRPRLQVTFAPGEKSSFNLNFTTYQTAPSLSYTDVVPQQIDGFQWQVGNPDLKTWSTYKATLRYKLNLKRFYGQIGLEAKCSPKAIAPALYWQDDRLITTYEHADNRQLAIWIAPQIEVIPEWLTVSGTLEYRLIRARGSQYNLNNPYHWCGDVTVQLRHWGFTLVGEYQYSERYLWGERISWGESFSNLTLSYNLKSWNFAVGLLCPFNKWDMGSRMLNANNSNTRHERTNAMPMTYLRLNYNLQWGRQKSGSRKLVQADSEVSTSSSASR